MTALATAAVALATAATALETAVIAVATAATAPEPAAGALATAVTAFAAAATAPRDCEGCSRDGSDCSVTVRATERQARPADNTGRRHEFCGVSALRTCPEKADGGGCFRSHHRANVVAGLEQGVTVRDCGAKAAANSHDQAAGRQAKVANPAAVERRTGPNFVLHHECALELRRVLA